MLEIVFGESACASLKMAQRYGSGGYKSAGIGVIVSRSDGGKPTEGELKAARRKAEEAGRTAWERAVPLGGSPADVYGFDLALSVGDISEDQPGVGRRLVLEQLYCVYPHEEGLSAAQTQLQRARDHLVAVCDRASRGEELRIWYSDQPDELCGLYWLLAQLVEVHPRISLVKLPEWDAGEGGALVRWTGWGEVAPGEWHRFLPFQRSVPPVFCSSCAARWRELQRENAPLRAVLNGRLVSAPETLYDDLILREIAAENAEFQEAAFIGRILGKYQLGIGDSWVALRLETLLHGGVLEVVTQAAEGQPLYHRILRKR